MIHHEKVHNPLRKLLINNFLGGIAWSFGTVVGATVIVALFGLIIAKIDFVPIVGTFISRVIHFIALNNSNLLQ